MSSTETDERIEVIKAQAKQLRSQIRYKRVKVEKLQTKWLELKSSKVKTYWQRKFEIELRIHRGTKQINSLKTKLEIVYENQYNHTLIAENLKNNNQSIKFI